MEFFCILLRDSKERKSWEWLPLWSRIGWGVSWGEVGNLTYKSEWWWIERGKEIKMNPRKTTRRKRHAWGWRMDGHSRTKQKTLLFNHSAYNWTVRGIVLLLGKDYLVSFSFFILNFSCRNVLLHLGAIFGNLMFDEMKWKWEPLDKEGSNQHRLCNKRLI